MHCRSLKSQIAQLKRTLEELSVSVEKLQPEHTAMNWAFPAGTVIYVPVRATRSDEPSRVDLAHPEVKGPTCRSINRMALALVVE